MASSYGCPSFQYMLAPWVALVRSSYTESLAASAMLPHGHAIICPSQKTLLILCESMPMDAHMMMSLDVGGHTYEHFSTQQVRSTDQIDMTLIHTIELSMGQVNGAWP